MHVNPWGRSYLLGESSQSQATPMDSQPTVTLVDIMAKLDVLTQTINQVNERLVKLETAREQLTTEEPPLQPNPRRNTPNNASDHDEQYLNSVKLDVPPLMVFGNPPKLLDWLQDMDRYFTLYPLSEPRKVKFTVMKLTG